MQYDLTHNLRRRVAAQVQTLPLDDDSNLKKVIGVLPLANGTFDSDTISAVTMIIECLSNSITLTESVGRSVAAQVIKTNFVNLCARKNLQSWPPNPALFVLPHPAGQPHLRNGRWNEVRRLTNGGALFTLSDQFQILWT